MSTITHDPQARLDYTWDWSSWLAAGETITTATVAPVDGLTISGASTAAGKVSVWISGGTTGQHYRVTCHIVTSAGREDDRTHSLYCSHR